MKYANWSSLGRVPLPGPITVVHGSGLFQLVHLGNALTLMEG